MMTFFEMVFEMNAFVFEDANFLHKMVEMRARGAFFFPVRDIDLVFAFDVSMHLYVSVHAHGVAFLVRF